MNSQQSAIENRKSKTLAPPARAGVENIKCPFCKSTDTELIALFGQQMMTSQYFCNNCRTGFEAVKWDARENPKSQKQNSTSLISNL